MKKNNKKQSFAPMKRTSAVVLSAGLLFGPVANLYYTSVAHAQTNTTKAESILAKLTPEQREALQKLDNHQLKTGLQLSKNIDLSSDKDVNVIVEFKDLPAKTAQIAKAIKGEKLSLAQANENVEKSHTQFRKDLHSKLKKTKSGKDAYHIKYTYKTSMNGVALTLPANQVKKLLDSKVVKAVYSDYTVQVEPPAQKEDAKDPTKVDSIPFLNLDKLHDEGYTGKGVKVGVIDTGVDYNHPDLKHAYKGGYDFVDNDNDPMETTYADWQKSKKAEYANGDTYYTDHGTHVSGTIAGRAENNSDYKVIGVAPEADLYVYRVLGPYGSGTTAAILAGVDKAVKDGMDVINLSLGASLNDPLYATSIAIDNAVLSGVTAVVAAGNSGDALYTLGSPGAAALALTVGASSVTSQVTSFESQFSSGSSNAGATMQLMTKKWTDDFSSMAGKSFDLVSVGQGGPNDYTGKDVNGKIAFIERGTYALIEKMEYARDHGASGVIIYNSNPDEGQIPFFLGESNDNIPTYSMTNKDGLTVKAMFANGIVPRVTIGAKSVKELSGDELATFSSRGPSGTLYDIKPEVTAPGVDILSTVPSYIANKNDTSDYSSAYLRMSGTSMASPHVAGVAALLLQAHPEYTPADVKTVLMNTADPLKNPYSVFEVGAGRIDPMKAVHSDTIISVQDQTPYIENGVEKIIPEQTGGLSYGFVAVSSAKDYTNTTKLSFNNGSDKDKKYDLSVEYNVGVKGSLDAKKNGVIVKVPDSITVKMNSTKQLSATLDIPKTAEKGIYEGYITIKEKNNPEESYRIPFGVKAADEGLAYFDVYTKSISTNRVINLFSRKDTDLDFRLNSSMQTLDWVLVDPKTNKDLGLITSVSATGAAVDTDYTMDSAFYGRYFPFTGDEKNPIGYVSEKAPDGIYDIKMIGTNKDGKQFVKTSKVSIDNNGPTIKFDDTNAMPKGDTQIVELAPGQDTVTVSGTILDPEISKTQAAGIPLTQANNKLFYGPGSSNAYSLSVDENGRFSTDVKVVGAINPIQYVGADFAGNATLPKMVYYTKPDASYIYAKPNKNAINYGDKITYTFYAHNLRKSNKLNFRLDYVAKYFDSVEFKKSQSLPEGSELTTTTTGTTSKGTTVTINVPGEGILGDVPLFDLDVDTNANEFINPFAQILNFSTMQVNNESTNRLQIIVGTLPMYPIYSTATAKLNGVGLYTAAGTFNSSIDYTTVGATMKAKSVNGVVYNGSIEKNGNVTFKGLPAAVQKYTVIMDIPGHFTTYTPLEIGRTERGINIGESVSYPTLGAKTGDINKDNVIDVMDAIYIQTYWGTNKRSADINFDGIVDAKDLALVEKNYLMQNPFITAAPKPVKKYKGSTLESIKSNLGL